MRRGNKRKFGRERNQRNNLLRSLATALIDHDKITTTKARAKTLSTYVDKLVTRAKKNDLATRRLLLQDLSEKSVKKLMSEVAPRFESRPGGYTRVVPLGQRLSDGAPMAQIEFTS